MEAKKIIAVAGATGAQGGGLVDAILNDENSEFAVRALTRDPNSDKAKELAERGAEVVEADVSDIESLKSAFEGAYGAYCVTFFWEHFSPEKEKEHAGNMAKAAQSAGLQHVVWSTFEDTRDWVPLSDERMPTLGEKYKVPHFDAKAEADVHFEEINVPVTYMRTSFYWDNLIHFGMEPQKGEDGNYYFTLPMGDKKLPGIAAEDIGKCAYGIFKAGEKYQGKKVGISGEQITGQGMASALSEALGINVIYNEVEPDVYRGFDFPGADDLGNMFQIKRDFEEEYCANREPEFSRSLNPELMSFKDWLDKYKDQIPVEK